MEFKTTTNKKSTKIAPITEGGLGMIDTILYTNRQKLAGFADFFKHPTQSGKPLRYICRFTKPL